MTEALGAVSRSPAGVCHVLKSRAAWFRNLDRDRSLLSIDIVSKFFLPILKTDTRALLS